MAGPILYGEGIKLRYASLDATTGVVGTYTDLPHRVTITGPDMEVQSVEKTTLDSTFKEFRPSNLPNPGTWSTMCYWDPLVVGGNDPPHIFLLKLFAPTGFGLSYGLYPRNILSWQAEFNNPVTPNTGKGTILTVLGFAQKYGLSGMQVDSNIQLNLDIKLTGFIEVTPAT